MDGVINVGLCRVHAGIVLDSCRVYAGFLRVNADNPAIGYTSRMDVWFIPDS